MQMSLFLFYFTIAIQYFNGRFLILSSERLAFAKTGKCHANLAFVSLVFFSSGYTLYITTSNAGAFEACVIHVSD